MKRRAKKLALTLVLSVSLLSMNMNFVYAEEMGLSENPEIGTDAAESNTITDGIDTTGETEAVTEETDGSTESNEETDISTDDENAGQSETGESKDEAEAGETSTDGTENGSDGTETATDGTENENQETDGSEETGEGVDGTDGSEETGEGVDGTDADDAAAADTTDGETPEKPYLNQNGDEILPSTLVGVDYDTIADSYDGATDVQKQYVVSDEYPENTIIESYVDENGKLVLVISQGVKTAEIKEDTGLLSNIASLFSLDAEMGSSASAPTVDGTFTGWDDIPASYEFNWNKPDAWVDGVHYTETNSTDVRHEMKLYSDGENVYLKVVFARELSTGQIANGNDYQFWIDNEQMAAYQVEWPNGNSLSYNTAEPGVYMVDVRHRDSSWSYVLTDGAVAYYRVNEGNLNNELELKIPLSEFVKQNPNINLDNYNMIGFFTPNLMQDKIYTAGASTGAEPFAAAVFLLVPTSYVLLKRKDDKEDMAFA